MSWRLCALIALVMFLSGVGVATVVLRRPPQMQQKTITVSDSYKSSKLDESWVWQYESVVPPKEVTRWKKVYRDAPTGGCVLASEEGTTEKTGPAPILISAKQAKHAEASGGSKTFDSHEALPLPPKEDPRWSIGVLGGVNKSLSPQAAVEVSYRVFGSFTLNALVTWPTSQDGAAAAFAGVGFTR